MSDLTRDAIKAIDDKRIIQVPVPEWGGTVYVRTLTSAERDEFEAERADYRKQDEELAKKHFRAMFVVATCCDKDGNYLFQPSDCAWLSGKNGAAMDRIFEATGRLNHFFASDIEELVKNLGGGQSAASG